MNIRRHRHFQFATNGGEQFATFAHADSTIGPHRSAVRFIVGSFKNERRRCSCTNACNPPSHSPEKFLGFNYAGTENERGRFAANDDGTDLQRLVFHKVEQALRLAKLKTHKRDACATIFFEPHHKLRKARRGARRKTGPVHSFAKDRAVASRTIN